MEKEYTKAKVKECNICHKPIILEDIEINNCISVITRGKTKKFAHKTCLVRR